MNHWTEELVEECVVKILAERDVCGNTGEAFLDFCSENDLPSKDDLFNERPKGTLDGRVEVWTRANARWDRDRRDAGVR